MYKYFLTLLVLFYSQHQMNAQPVVDSLKMSLKHLKHTERIDQLNQIFRQYVCSRPDSALVYHALLKTDLKKLDYARGEVETVKNYGTMKYCMGQLDSALYYFEQAAQQAREDEVADLEGVLYNNMGSMYRMKGEIDKALINYQKCRNVGLQLNDTLLILSSTNGLGDLLKKRGYLDSALNYFLAAEQMAMSNQNLRMLVPTRLNIYAIYFKSQPENLNEAEINETKKWAEELNDKISIASLLQLLGGKYYNDRAYDQAIKVMEEGLSVLEGLSELYVSINLNQGIANAYEKKGEYLKAISYNNEGIALAKKGGMSAELLHLYGNNASNYLELKNYPEAIKHANLALSFTDSTEIDEYVPEIHEYLARIYAETGEFERAYAAQREHYLTYKEFEFRKNKQQLAELQTQYETEKKEAAIASLSQQAVIQGLEIEQKNLTISIGAVFVILIGGVIFFTYRQRSFKNKQAQMELEQRFLRSQLNPHFISNALLAVQNFMLKNQADQAATYLSKFAKLMRETLENSRQEFIPIEDEVQMLTNYLDIHKMRMNNAFDFDIHLDENIDPESDTIPPMFIQPFVENAIVHGMEPEKRKGNISLHFAKEGEFITIAVKDNGGGYSSIRPENMERRSLSTTIIRERINLFNKSLKRKIQLVLVDITSENGEIMGAKVELKVPFQYV
ncbi:MAG: histidine kinase [Reichenbachiella sp.]|uniref:tetratricopeptide repeat-containing sensor histidine kinase n=1 Tax=Reichenbachiella sp. TaxID=2184521 RepID=UPI0032984F13